MNSRVSVWSLAIGLCLGSSAWAMPAQFGLSPDNSERLLVDALNSAQSSITINIYQFDSSPITDVLADLIRQGITTRVLIEAEPFSGRMAPQGVASAKTLRDAMTASGNAGDHLYFMETSRPGVQRRFKFDHAKYAVIDSRRALLSSDNFSDNGHPLPGMVGNRGWDVLLEDAALVAQLEGIFQSDSRTDLGDVVEIGPNDLADAPPAGASPSAHVRDNPAYSIGSGNVASARLVTSPNSLDGMLQIYRSATQHLEVETMSLPAQWYQSGGQAQSPIVTEIVSAARRGANVRVILNDDNAFNSSDGGNPPVPTGFLPLDNASNGASQASGNLQTARYLLKLAHCQNLPIEARIAGLQAIGLHIVHNKGALADGRFSLVSSINGTRNSVMNNRETAVLLDSPDAAQYFGRAFDYDWQNSPPLPAANVPCGMLNLEPDFRTTTPIFDLLFPF